MGGATDLGSVMNELESRELIGSSTGARSLCS